MISWIIWKSMDIIYLQLELYPEILDLPSHLDLISGSKLFSVATSTGKASVFRGSWQFLMLAGKSWEIIKMEVDSWKIIELNP